jgi:hypothetical protein
MRLLLPRREEEGVVHIRHRRQLPRPVRQAGGYITSVPVLLRNRRRVRLRHGHRADDGPVCGVREREAPGVRVGGVGDAGYHGRRRTRRLPCHVYGVAVDKPDVQVDQHAHRVQAVQRHQQRRDAAARDEVQGHQHGVVLGAVHDSGDMVRSGRVRRAPRRPRRRVRVPLLLHPPHAR